MFDCVALCNLWCYLTSVTSGFVCHDKFVCAIARRMCLSVDRPGTCGATAPFYRWNVCPGLVLICFL
uniref:Putative secreted protein n=1 Tax=Anopheles darlingi TaxID=43151 RepID=A0A2M4DNH1_ANODA